MNMKKFIMIMVLGALVACLVPTEANAQDWQTNTMQGSGSAYSSQVTPVGAQNVEPQATTTTTRTSHQITGRRNFDTGGDSGQGPSPIGSEWTLLLFVALAAGVMVMKKKVINAKNQQS